MTVHMSHIIAATCLQYRVTLDQIKGPCRERQFAHPRQVAMTLARKLTNYSFAAIGAEFGGRDHTTVLHAIQATRKRMTDQLFAEMLLIEAAALDASAQPSIAMFKTTRPKPGGQFFRHTAHAAQTQGNTQ